MASLILGLGCFLTVAGTGLVDRWQRSALQRQSLSFEDLLGAVAVATGLLIVVWWVLCFAAALAAAMFERAGRRRAAAASGRFSPAFMRRLALAILGVQLIGVPLAQADSQPVPGGLGHGSVAVAAAWTPVEGEPRPEPAQQPRGEGNPRSADRHAGSTVQQLPGHSDLRPQWQPPPPAPAPGPVMFAQLRAARGRSLPGILVLRHPTSTLPWNGPAGSKTTERSSAVTPMPSFPARSSRLPEPARIPFFHSRLQTVKHVEACPKLHYPAPPDQRIES